MKIIPFLLLTFPALAPAAWVTLNWQTNSEPDIAAYIIHAGTNSRVYTLATNVGNVTTGTITGLSPDQTWFLAVSARNTNNVDSGYSDELIANLPLLLSNTPPTIAPIAAQLVSEDSVAHVEFTVWDAESSPSNLVVTVSSTNTALIPGGRISLGGDGPYRHLHITPLTNAFGLDQLTIMVSDGQATNSRSFLLTVVDVPEPPQRVTIYTRWEWALSPEGPWTRVMTNVISFELDPAVFWRVTR